jgi:hypothetical protein
MAGGGNARLLLALDDGARHLVRFLLVPVSRWANRELALDLAGTLLHDVGQLVGQQLAAAGAAGIISPVAEEDILAGSESARVERATELVGLGASMNPRVTKVSAKSLLHLDAHAVVQGLPLATSALDALFHVGAGFPGAVSRPGQSQHPAHVAVPTLALQLKQGMPGPSQLPPRGLAQHRRLSLGTGRWAERAQHIGRRVSLGQGTAGHGGGLRWTLLGSL